MNPEDAHRQAPKPAAPPRDAPLDHAVDHALDHALSRLDGLGAVTVHEHVDVYTAVDRALRERLAATEA
jgi:hypothetical protein